MLEAKQDVALEYASALKDDREIVPRPSSRTGMRWNTPRRQDDREIVLAPSANWNVLYDKDGRAGIRLGRAENDREIVLEAVKQNRLALRDASAALKDDREMLEAARRNGLR